MQRPANGKASQSSDTAYCQRATAAMPCDVGWGSRDASWGFFTCALRTLSAEVLLRYGAVTSVPSASLRSLGRESIGLSFAPAASTAVVPPVGTCGPRFGRSDQPHPFPTEELKDVRKATRSRNSFGTHHVRDPGRTPPRKAFATTSPSDASTRRRSSGSRPTASAATTCTWSPNSQTSPRPGSTNKPVEPNPQPPAGSCRPAFSGVERWIPPPAISKCTKP